MGVKSGEKGTAAEEALRAYFSSIGYFVVRSVPFSYKTYDVTDVDLWLYVKATSLSTERICVDIKRKRTPQAMERVLWTKGLKDLLGVDRAIVVTTDNRPETRDFGAAHGVGVLHGDFLQRVVTGFTASERITEENLFALINTPCVVDAGVKWPRWYRSVKAMLLDGLNFDGCNKLLLSVKLLLDEYLSTGKSNEVPVRLLYAVIAYLLICLDYTSRSFVQLDLNARKAVLTDGFRYGEAGSQRTEEIVQMALQLLVESGKTDLFSHEELRGEFERQVDEYHAEVLGEYFAKADSLKHLFELSRSFENQAYSKTLLKPDQCPSDQKGIIGLFCDFLGHDRKSII